MESILQFMYLGEASFYAERTNEFLRVAKDLDLKEIGPNVDVNVEKQEATLGETTSDMNASNQVKDIDLTHKKAFYPMNEKGRIVCDICFLTYSKKANLLQHIRSKHEGINYPCEKCNYKASQVMHLQRHIETFHEGIRYK